MRLQEQLTSSFFVKFNPGENNHLEKYLGIKLDQVYCISIDIREDRRKDINMYCNELGIKVKFLIVKRHKDPTLGCLRSHILCVKDAKKNKYNNILILEDDAMINVETVKRNTISVPKDFDMLYLGYNINNGYKHSKDLLKVVSAQCLHSYVLNKRVFNYVLENVGKDWESFPEYMIRNVFERQVNFKPRAIDLFYGKIVNQIRGKSYGVYPMISLQKPSFSDIENKEVDYNKIMVDKSNLFSRRFVKDFPTYVVNLDRREDRLKTFQEKYNNIFSGFLRVSAIDGRTYDFDKFINLFDINKYSSKIKNPYKNHQYKKGVLGCSLSHYLLWVNIVQQERYNDLSYSLILEDDIELCDDFVQKYNELLKVLDKDDKWDVVYLGFTDYKDTNDTTINDKLIKFSGDKRLHGGGTFAYIVRKRGARKLIQLANKHKIQQAIDWFMIEQFDEVVSYKCEPELIFSEVDGNETDVQNNDVLALNSQFKSFLINNKQYYIDSSMKLFKFEKDEMEYEGYIKDKQIVKDSVPKNIFKLNVPKNDKEYIVFYVKKPTQMIRRICESLAKKYNVILVSHYVFNIILNDVIYVCGIKDNILNIIQTSLKAKNFFTDNLDIFLLMNKTTSINIYWLSIDTIEMEQHQKCVYKLGGINFLKNMYNSVTKFIFFSEQMKRIYKAMLNLATDEKLVMSPYVLEKIEIDLVKQPKKNIIVCYDKHFGKAIDAFNEFDDCKLILFTNYPETFPPLENVVYFPRNHTMFIKTCAISKYYLTFENELYTHYKALTAMNSGCVCMVPKILSDIKNVCVSFDKLEDSDIEKAKSLTIGKKNDIYKTLCKKIIVKHMNNNFWSTF